MQYMMVSDAARLWQIAPEQVRAYCARGQVAGARRAGALWLIPRGARVRRGRTENFVHCAGQIGGQPLH